MTTHRIICGNSTSIPEVPNGTVNLVFTSPPYPMIEMWDSVFSSQDASISDCLAREDGEGAFDRMHSILDAVWTECDRVLADQGFVCVNIGDATRSLGGVFKMYPNHVRIVDWFVKKGYSVLPDILWRKPSNAPNKFMGSGMFPAGAYVTYEHEYILIFRKGGKRRFTSEQKALRQKSAFFWEERNVWFSDLWEINGASQQIRLENRSRERNASFPFVIPYRIVNMYSAEGDVVLDPFAGFGTTSLACMASNRNSIGVDIDPRIADEARKNLLKREKALNSVIDDRIRRHVSFIEALPGEKRQKCYRNTCHDFDVKTRQEVNIKIDRISEISAVADGVLCQMSA